MQQCPTCAVGRSGLASDDATWNSNCSHVHEVDKVGEAPKVAILGPSHSCGLLLIRLNLCARNNISVAIW